MEQKDYKEIAKIIKDHRIWNSDTNFNKTSLNSLDLRLVNKLADYFEKDFNEWHLKRGINSYGGFNRKQFLTECGING